MNNALQIPDPPAPLNEPIGPGVLLFEQPWLLMVLVLFAGLAASWWLQRHGSGGRAASALLAGIALAGGLWLLARIVVTDREEVMTRTRQLVGATAKARTSELAGLLDDRVRLQYFRAPAGLDKQGVLCAVEADLGQTYRVTEWALQEFQAVRESDTRMHTQIRVRVTPEAWNFPHVSWWAVDWEKRGSVWKAVAIRPIVIQFHPGDPGG